MSKTIDDLIESFNEALTTIDDEAISEQEKVVSTLILSNTLGARALMQVAVALEEINETLVSIDRGLS